MKILITMITLLLSINANAERILCKNVNILGIFKLIDNKTEKEFLISFTKTEESYYDVETNHPYLNNGQYLSASLLQKKKGCLIAWYTPKYDDFEYSYIISNSKNKIEVGSDQSSDKVIGTLIRK